MYPDEASDWARKLFIREACALEPEIAKSFYRNVWRKSHAPTQSDRFKELIDDAAGFEKLIDAWARKWNLKLNGRTPYWVISTAESMILRWEAYYRFSPWADPLPADLHFDAGPSEPDDASWVATHKTYKIVFQEYAWQPQYEKKAMALKRIAAAVNADLRQQLNENEAAAREVFRDNPEKDSTRHYFWLARRVIKHESIQEISANPGPVVRGRGHLDRLGGPVEETAVRKALKETAALVGVSLPEGRDLHGKKQVRSPKQKT